MSQKTTVYLDPASYRVLKEIALAEGRPSAALIREAVSEYSIRHARRRRPKSLGAFRSGRKDLSERAEELLSGIGMGGPLPGRR
jgi:hypothetical protein